MANRSFAAIGYINEEQQFEKQDIRARDVYASNGTSAEDHINAGSIHLTPEQATLIAGAIQAALLGQAGGVATLGEDGHIPAQQLDLGKYATAANVADYAEMLALTTEDADVNTFIFVADATGDPTVENGWASYKRVAANGDAGDFVKVAEGESLDINIPDLEQGITEAKAAAGAAQSTADTAEGKADDAQNAASAAQDAADAAQAAANAAAAEAAKLDFAYCTSEADMASKNLRVGAVVLMAVDND